MVIFVPIGGIYRRAQQGFTLIELLVVLMIMTLMVALVPPLLSGVGLTTEVRGAARQLAAGLRLARSEAV
ncbi:MAG: prepilin-type N-terminal cleavage/methylation domain-containing protein, partial [Candidatus Competibacterales bacterium]|nr:prepilin-type N-terminal cleavage/methylation domain-containing protein [Candidatus Competibacterales bacterium]